MQKVGDSGVGVWCLGPMLMLMHHHDRTEKEMAIAGGGCLPALVSEEDEQVPFATTRQRCCSATSISTPVLHPF